MAHDPTLGFADYFSAAAAAADEGAPELYGLHADMEFLGMRGGLAAVPAAAHSKAVLDDAGPDGSAATMQFLVPGGHQQQASQAPLSLSLFRPDGVVTLHEHLGGGGSSRQQQQQPAAWTMQQQDYSAPSPAAWHLRSSRFLLPAQQLLHEFCSLPVDSAAASNNNNKRAKAATATPSSQQQEDGGGGGGGGEGSSASPSPQIQAMDAVELQRLKDKLYIMLEEADRRYRRYCEQMRSLAGGFEAVAGERAATAYTALASRTISRHFRSLRDGIVAQLRAARKALGEKDVPVPGMTRGDTPRLRVLDQCIRQHKALTQAGMMESHPWRPQRGLPERAVTILRAWLFEHFLHPYPSDVDKHILSRQTGLSRSQVSNWFINARVRLWKPMVEEMYLEEMKDGQDDGSGGGGGSGGQQSVNPNPSSSHASEAHGSGGAGGHEAAPDAVENGVDRKPTRAQLMHDAGSLASVVNIGGGITGAAGGVSRLENFGLLDHLDFDAYGGGGGDHQQGGGFGGVSLTLGLQQHDSPHDGGVNIAFGAPSSAHHQHHGGAVEYLFATTAGGGHQQMDGGVHQAQHGHHVQFGAAAGGGVDGDAPHNAGQDHYRSLSAGFNLLRDLAG